MNDPDTAHKVLQDIVSKVGTSPVIEEERATVYFHHKHYQEALNIYERILPEWNPPPEKLDLGACIWMSSSRYLCRTFGAIGKKLLPSLKMDQKELKELVGMKYNWFACRCGVCTL